MRPNLELTPPPTYRFPGTCWPFLNPTTLSHAVYTKFNPHRIGPLQAEEVDARLLSGLITGVRRAFPYVMPEDVEPLVEESATQMFRLVHTAPFTVAVQSLMLMYQLMSARAAISDR
jgi:hypothetical protein